MRNLTTLFIVALFITVWAACTPVPTPTNTPLPTPTPMEPPILGNPRNGAQIFTQGVNQSPPCSTCHFVTSGLTGFNLGPNLARIAERAGNRVEGLSVVEYLHESIVDPHRYVLPGYRDLMYPDYATHFSEENVQDLIAYLLTLEG